jgi:hypothetical protein
MIFCEICCYNDADLLFDCDDYTLPPFGSYLHQLSVYTGYNHVINPNSYNPVFACNNCLYEKIFNCDIENKCNVLYELKIDYKLKNNKFISERFLIEKIKSYLI